MMTIDDYATLPQEARDKIMDLEIFIGDVAALDVDVDGAVVALNGIIALLRAHT